MTMQQQWRNDTQGPLIIELYSSHLEGPTVRFTEGPVRITEGSWPVEPVHITDGPFNSFYRGSLLEAIRFIEGPLGGIGSSIRISTTYRQQAWNVAGFKVLLMPSSESSLEGTLSRLRKTSWMISKTYIQIQEQRNNEIMA